MTKNLKEFIKNFTNWFALKPKLDQSNHKSPFVKEGQIWWCYLGENIGTEVSGKGQKFTRPAVILQKLSHYTYLIIPTSTQIKTGSWFVAFTYKNTDMVACLNQIRIVDHRRLDNRLGFLDDVDFGHIKNGFNNLFYQKNMPPKKEDAGKSRI